MFSALQPTETNKIACDAFPYGIGAVLSHYIPNGSEKPVTFASRTLSQTEQNYSQIEKKLLQLFMLSKSFINTYLENVLFCSQIINHY